MELLPLTSWQVLCVHHNARFRVAFRPQQPAFLLAGRLGNGVAARRRRMDLRTLLPRVSRPPIMIAEAAWIP